MSLQMPLTAVWVCDDLEAFCLLRFVLVTNLTWDMNRSADVDPLHISWMYNEIRKSPASEKDNNLLKEIIVN